MTTPRPSLVSSVQILVELSSAIRRSSPQCNKGEKVEAEKCRMRSLPDPDIVWGRVTPAVPWFRCWVRESREITLSCLGIAFEDAKAQDSPGVCACRPRV